MSQREIAGNAAMSDDRRKKIVRILGIVLALVSGISTYFAWRDYQRLKNQSNKPRNVNINKNGKDVPPGKPSVAGRWMPLLKNSRAVSWETFQGYCKTDPRLARNCLDSLDFGEAGFNSKLYEKVFAEGSTAIKISSLESICLFDMTHPDLPQSQRAMIFSLVTQLLDKNPQFK